MVNGLKTVVPIFIGVALWNIMPNLTAKLVLLGVCAVGCTVPMLRGRVEARARTGRDLRTTRSG